MQNSSTFPKEHNRLFIELQNTLEKGIAQLAGRANGGRSILFIYPPVDDDAYIAEGRQRLAKGYQFIDLRQLLCDFISSMRLAVFEEHYHNFQKEVFYSDNFLKESFFYVIMQKIQKAFTERQIPVLVHTGTLYGMNFSNINILEHPCVIVSQIPLIVFYPATIEQDSISFLGRQIASQYRCIVIK